MVPPDADGTVPRRGEVMEGAGSAGFSAPWWRRFAGSDEPGRLLLRAVVVTALVAVAYQYSLSTLLSSLSQETPLAYLGLVPVISLLLIAGLLYLPGRPQRDIHDRYLDYLVGVPLLAIAVLIVTIGPAFMSTFFWLWRFDMISLPLFVAGAIALAFGSRMLWRLRLPVAFLLLAWPPIYTLFLNGWLNQFTNLTLAALHALLRVVPLAVPVAFGDGSLFQITSGGGSFVLSVASACAGVNSVLGFLLVGMAAAALVRGPRRLKLLWLVLGMALIWLLDLVRILLIFAAGGLWGEGFAMNVLHPAAGLIVFALGVVVMILALPRFHLTVLGAPARAAGAGAARAVAEPHRPAPRPAVRRAGIPLLILAVAGAVVAVADLRMGQFQLLAQDLGPPRVAAFTVANSRISGWSVDTIGSYTFGKLEFGSDSTWYRYLYLPGTELTSATSAQTTPVTLDVVSTSDVGSFSTYTVEDCYHFHDYPVVAQSTASLGGGVVGHAVVYEVQGFESWTAVYWEWPVQTSHGLWYQRIVLNETTEGSPATSEANLVAFARQVVDATGRQAPASAAT
jgi:exosortase/archaeosortase family protein